MALRVRALISLCLLAGLFSLPQSQAGAADSVAIKKAFSQLAATSTLADPSVIVLDEQTGAVIFQSNSNSARKPASVIKIISATAAYKYLSPMESFTTSMWEANDGKSLVIQGSLDPWMSFDNKVAEKMGRTSLGRFEYNALNAIKRLNGGSTQETTIYYSGLYSQEVSHFVHFLKDKNAATKLVRLSAKRAQAESTNFILESHSPTVETMVNWLLTWSDNLLAERMARLAAVAAGNTLDTKGISKTFTTMLNEMGISTANMVVKDGSGLSKSNRFTARQISEVLLYLYQNAQYAQLVKGFPIGGVSGTLQNRFVDTAPGAIGLVRAKTGTLNGTTNLAGYVESGERQYIFVVIADRHSKSYTVTKKVRATVDRILGKIASPLLPNYVQNTSLPSAPPSESATTTS